MNNRLIKNLVVMVVVIGMAGFILENDDEVTVNTVINPVNYQTIVLKDSYDTLIPLEVDLKVSTNLQEQVVSTINQMKSNEYIDYGLYPVFSEDVYVSSILLENEILYITFNDMFLAKNNQEALDFAESLSYVFCNDDIKRVSIIIDDEVITHIPNSTIAVSAMTSNLGINNFSCDSNEIYKTIPMMVYNTTVIGNQIMYVPETIRVTSHEDDFDLQVSSLLNCLNSEKELVLEGSVSLISGVLSVHLDNCVLDSDEFLDTILFNQLSKSLNSIQSVSSVCIYIDNVLQEAMQDVSIKINNRIEF